MVLLNVKDCIDLEEDLSVNRYYSTEREAMGFVVDNAEKLNNKFVIASVCYDANYKKWAQILYPFNLDPRN